MFFIFYFFLLIHLSFLLISLISISTGSLFTHTHFSPPLTFCLSLIPKPHIHVVRSYSQLWQQRQQLQGHTSDNLDGFFFGFAHDKNKILLFFIFDEQKWVGGGLSGRLPPEPDHSDTLLVGPAIYGYRRC